MAATLAGIVYDTLTREVRRVVIPDDDSELYRHAEAGESILCVRRPKTITFADIAALVAMVRP